MPDVLNVLVAFVTEHQRCGELDGGRDGGGDVWRQCRAGPGSSNPLLCLPKHGHERDADGQRHPVAMSKRTARVTVSRCLLVAALPGLALVASASADIGTLEGTGEWVAVWQSPLLAKEGQDLVNAGQYDLAAQRMA